MDINNGRASSSSKGPEESLVTERHLVTSVKKFQSKMDLEDTKWKISHRKAKRKDQEPDFL